MKNKKNKEQKIFWIWMISLVALFILAVVALDIFLIKDQETITQNNTKNAIRLSTGDIDFAIVYVINGNLDAKIINSQVAEAKNLRDSFEEISKKETLPLMVEPKLGLIQVVEIPRNNSNYIYAVAEYFRGKGFETKAIYLDYQKQYGELSWIECFEIYHKIDNDLKNANYCENDSDCKTLPLAGPYIEFGCYYYINLEENSTDFYQRMNYYSIVCSDIIDLCSPIPDSKCVLGKCVEADLSFKN